MSDYPEHLKLKAVQDQSQRIGDFIEWLGENDMAVCAFDPKPNYDNYTPTREPITKLLGRFFEIDLDKLEDEKRAMIDEMSRGFDRRPP